MVQYDKYILNALIDSYENSVLFTETNKVKLDIKFVFNKKNIPVYFDESSSEYERIHVIVENLQHKGFVNVFWKQQGFLSKVTLQLEMLEAIYAYLHRKPKKMQIMDAKTVLLEYRNSYTTTVITRFLEYLSVRIDNNQSVKEYMDITDLQQFQLVVKAITAIEENDTPRYVREFSIATFQDSKIFEKIKGKVIRVFRDFADTFADKEEEEILAEYNIYHTPNYVYLKGNVMLSIEDQTIPLHAMTQGIGISGEDIEKCSLVECSSITSVMTIENLTSFFRCNRKRCLMIYLGGYHNSIRRRLLNQIYQSLPDVEYYHFGDIDAGGFDIYRDLKEKTGIPFKMYKMDLDTLKEYERFAKPLTKNDRERLEKLVSKVDKESVTELVEYMLKHNIKLEQECIL